jgi:hypothetical protein
MEPEHSGESALSNGRLDEFALGKHREFRGSNGDCQRRSADKKSTVHRGVPLKLDAVEPKLLMRFSELVPPNVYRARHSSNAFSQELGRATRESQIIQPSPRRKNRNFGVRWRQRRPEDAERKIDYTSDGARLPIIPTRCQKGEGNCIEIAVTRMTAVETSPPSEGCDGEVRPEDHSSGDPL